MGAKGCNGRGGYANGKRFCSRRHGSAQGRKGRARRAAAVEKAYETIERRAGREAISDALDDIYAAEWATELAYERKVNGY